ncbi:hypothetical protein KA107_00280 [Candidatus Pacearchaeota archaeon]|nr:hypothetical protein [Candidatus Pacearchaeota archaeon]
MTNLKKEHIFLLLAFFLVFILGYYLRSYIPTHADLPGSPYEVYSSNTPDKLLSSGEVHDYKDKATRYPVSQIINSFLPKFFKEIYLAYILGAVAIFFLGKELSQRNLGGFLAFAGYALAGENLLAYMTTIGSSSLCYIFIWTSLLFLIKYTKNKQNSFLILFIMTSLLSLMTYHTGATALIMILLGMFVSFIYSKTIDRKIIYSFIFILMFYLSWLILFDVSQINLVLNSINGHGKMFVFFAILTSLLILLGLFIISRIKFLRSEYFPLGALILSGFLTFYQGDIFSKILSLGVDNYYVSNITLNNYFAQAILLHVYAFALIPLIFKKNLNEETIFLRGWFLGLGIVFVGLYFEGYLARILDYSFPLTFILFSLYWLKHEKFRKTVVVGTLILLTISQLMIYNDPYSMRRYYTSEETVSAKNIIDLNFTGTIASDLRTSALFSHFGKRDVLFAREDQKLHKYIFYSPEKVRELNVSYVILSENMRVIVYGMNFETTPLTQETFNYYDRNFEKVYEDKTMKVYKIK